MIDLGSKTDKELHDIAIAVRVETEKRKWHEYGISSVRGYNVEVSVRRNSIIKIKIGDCVSEVEPMYLNGFIGWYNQLPESE